MGLRPAPCLRVERLTGASNETQAGDVVLPGNLLAMAHEHTQRGGRRKHLGHPVALDDFPGNPRIRKINRAFAE